MMTVGVGGRVRLVPSGVLWYRLAVSDVYDIRRLPGLILRRQALGQLRSELQLRQIDRRVGFMRAGHFVLDFSLEFMQLVTRRIVTFAHIIWVSDVVWPLLSSVIVWRGGLRVAMVLDRWRRIAVMHHYVVRPFRIPLVVHRVLSHSNYQSRLSVGARGRLGSRVRNPSTIVESRRCGRQGSRARRGDPVGVGLVDFKFFFSFFAVQPQAPKRRNLRAFYIGKMLAKAPHERFKALRQLKKSPDSCACIKR